MGYPRDVIGTLVFSNHHSGSYMKQGRFVQAVDFVFHSGCLECRVLDELKIELQVPPPPPTPPSSEALQRQRPIKTPQEEA